MIASVDGCRKGWLVAKSPLGRLPWSVDILVLRTFREVVDQTEECKVVVVDMPIGLPGCGHRECDRLAREELGNKRQSSVFYAPPRRTLSEADWDVFKQLHKEANGQGLSRQVFDLRKKLVEVDDLMQPVLQKRIREFHPELAWKKLSGNTLSSKHSAAGILQRFRILKELFSSIETFADSALLESSSTGIDDLFDALVGLQVAFCIANKHVPPYKLPAKSVQPDGKDLKMEIWY